MNRLAHCLTKSRFLTTTLVAATLGAAACSPGHTLITPPPPTGNYTLASLNGTYAFTTSGEVFDGASFNLLARVGSFVADGQGHITGGSEDVNKAGSPSAAMAITGGNYKINPDGRGTLTLDFGGTSIDFGITLTSTSDGLMIDETTSSTQASTGSGNFILQQSTPFALTEFNGNYVFDFAGLDGAAPPNQNPESFIGQFTADATTGTIPTGIFDDNDGGQLVSGGMTPGTFSQDPLQQSGFTSFGRGIATIAGQNFVFYMVNGSRIRFLSTSNGMLSGDAVLQANIPSNLSAINGGFAFLVAGASGNGGLVRVGRFTVSNGAVSKILMDVNDAGTQTPFNTLSNPTINYDPTTGRGDLSFQSSAVTTFSFVFYLSSQSGGVIQEVSGPNATTAVVVDDGSLLLQSGSPFTSSNITGPYALNWSGQVSSSSAQDEEDFLGQAAVTNLSLSGTSDLFQFTSPTLTPNFDLGTGGQITLNGGNGTGDDGKRVNMDVNLSNTSSIHMVVYMVSPQLAFFMNRDNNGALRIVAGILKAQQ